MNQFAQFVENKEAFKTTNISSRKTPNACAIIWNFKYRLGSHSDFIPDSVADIMKIQKKLVLTKSILQIKTEKTKYACEGKFELILAPNKNWTSELTLGSWICIMMSPNNKITRADIDQANPKLVKFIGVIKSVGTTVRVSETGARTTAYIVSGVDWATAFLDRVYLDPSWSTLSGEKGFSSLAQAIYLNNINLGEGIATSADFNTYRNIRLVNKLWLDVAPNVDEEGKSKLNETKLYWGNIISFSVPTEVLDFMGYEVAWDETNHAMANYLNIKTGKINEDKQYADPDNFKIIKLWDMSRLFGQNTVWQLYNSVNAEHIEELFNDLYIEDIETSKTISQSLGGFVTGKDIGDRFFMSPEYKMDPLSNKLAPSYNQTPNLSGLTTTLNSTTTTTTNKKIRFTLFNRICPFSLRDAKKTYRYKGEQEYSYTLPKSFSNFNLTKPSISKDPRLSLTLPNPVGPINFTLESDNFKKVGKPSTFNQDMVVDLTSYFCNIPRTEIPLGEVLSVSYSIDLSDKINILEIGIDQTNTTLSKLANIDNTFRHQQQEWENMCLFARDGLKLRKFIMGHFVFSNEYLNQSRAEELEKKAKDEIKAGDLPPGVKVTKGATEQQIDAIKKELASTPKPNIPSIPEVPRTIPEQMGKQASFEKEDAGSIRIRKILIK